MVERVVSAVLVLPGGDRMMPKWVVQRSPWTCVSSVELIGNMRQLAVTPLAFSLDPRNGITSFTCSSLCARYS